MIFGPHEFVCIICALVCPKQRKNLFMSACWLLVCCLVVSQNREIWTESERRVQSNAEINRSAGLDQE